MENMRLALSSDRVRLQEIWKLCFGDPDLFVDFYFTQRFQPEQTAVYLDMEIIAAMLTMIPVQWVDAEEGQRFDGAMLYAIATHPDYQHRGIATKLMNWALCYLRDHEVDLCVLVPAHGELFKFYHKQGYQEGFTLRETVLSREEIRDLLEGPGGSGMGHLNCQIQSTTPHTYSRIREQLLQGTTYIAYKDEEIAYQKKVSQLSGGDLFRLDIAGVQGCAALERLSKDKVLVKELLLPENMIRQGVKALAEVIEAQEFIIRTPDQMGKDLGGQCRPFGMIKSTLPANMKEIHEEKGRPLNKMGYLGLAFD